MSTAKDQETHTAHRLQLEARDKRIAELEAAVARHERANGRLVADLQEAREECATHRADVLRLEALVERHGLNAAPGAEDGDVDPERPTYEQCIAHMRRGGVIQAGNALQRRTAGGHEQSRVVSGNGWWRDWRDESHARTMERAPGFYHLLPIKPSVAKP